MQVSKPLSVFYAVFLGLSFSFQYISKMEGIKDFFLDTVETILERAKGVPPKSNRTLLQLAGFLNILVKQVDRIVFNPSFAPDAHEVTIKAAMFEMEVEFESIVLNNSLLTNVFNLTCDQIKKYKEIMKNTEGVMKNITDFMDTSY
ncbi:hypothetical protein J6590_026050 [Homalodisca vitripennis]|nr:hypothetical protein J6590_026050 [Homalodisca vitripennis]